MGITRISNYEIMKKQMSGEFVKYDQEKMIRKFSLPADGDFIYIRFVGRDYRIDRKTGAVEWSEDGFATAAEADSTAVPASARISMPSWVRQSPRVAS